MVKDKKTASPHINATLSLDESVRMPLASWTIHSIRSTPDDLQALSHLGISLHSVTHLDLPGSRLGGFNNLPYENIQRLQNDYVEKLSEKLPHAFSTEAFIVNLHAKSLWLENLLAKAMSRTGLQGRLPARPIELWTSSEYEEILNHLAVSKSNITTLLEGVATEDDLNGKSLILFTGWRAFTPLYKDCGSPNWWAWHPFLLYPYLTRDAAEWLINCDVRVVGTDAISFDSPLTYWFALHQDGLKPPWEAIRQALTKRFLSTTKNSKYRWDSAPVRSLLLGKDISLIASLSLPTDALYLSQGGFVGQVSKTGIRIPSCAKVFLTIMPFGCRQTNEALLTYVLILPFKE